ECLPRHAEDQVDRDAPDVPPRRLDGWSNMPWLVPTLQHAQHLRLKRLHPQADAVNTMIGKEFCLVSGKRVRVGLERRLGTRVAWQPVVEIREQPFELAHIQLRWRPAAQE